MGHPLERRWPFLTRFQEVLPGPSVRPRLSPGPGPSLPSPTKGSGLQLLASCNELVVLVLVAVTLHSLLCLHPWSLVVYPSWPLPRLPVHSACFLRERLHELFLCCLFSKVLAILSHILGLCTHGLVRRRVAYSGRYSPSKFRIPKSREPCTLVAEKKKALFYVQGSRQTYTTHMKNAWWWCVTYEHASRRTLTVGTRTIGRGEKGRKRAATKRAGKNGSQKVHQKSNFLATVASEKRIFTSKISRVVTQLICISRQKKARHFPCQPFVYEKLNYRNY